MNKHVSQHAPSINAIIKDRFTETLERRDHAFAGGTERGYTYSLIEDRDVIKQFRAAAVSIIQNNRHLHMSDEYMGLSNDHMHCILAHYERRIIGFSLFSVRASESSKASSITIHLDMTYVNGDHRSRGVGAQLYRLSGACIGEAIVQQGARAIENNKKLSVNTAIAVSKCSYGPEDIALAEIDNALARTRKLGALSAGTKHFAVKSQDEVVVVSDSMTARKLRYFNNALAQSNDPSTEFYLNAAFNLGFDPNRAYHDAGEYLTPIERAAQLSLTCLEGLFKRGADPNVARYCYATKKPRSAFESVLFEARNYPYVEKMFIAHGVDLLKKHSNGKTFAQIIMEDGGDTELTSLAEKALLENATKKSGKPVHRKTDENSLSL